MVRLKHPPGRNEITCEHKRHSDPVEILDTQDRNLIFDTISIDNGLPEPTIDVGMLSGGTLQGLSRITEM